MKIAGRTEELHVYGLEAGDREALKELGYEYLGYDDIYGNEVWGREEDFFVGRSYLCSHCNGICYEDISPKMVFRDNKTIICEKCSIDYEEVKVIKRRDNTLI